MIKPKLVRVTTVPISLGTLLRGQLHYMSAHYEVIGISADDPSLDEIANREKIRVIPVRMTRKISPIKDLKSLWQLYRIFKQEKPHIVHSHTPKAGTMAMMAACMAGVPHRLHTVAGLPLLESRGIFRIILNVVEKFTYRCATKIYPNSNGLRDIILGLKFTHPEKLKVIGHGSSNGINTDYFQPGLYSEPMQSYLRNVLGIDKEDKVLLFVGRLVGDKGINELVCAFTSLYEEYPNTKLVLVGPRESHLDPLSKKTINLIHHHPGIICTGKVEDVRPYYDLADMLVFPSYREGFPNVVLQAAAMGLPCIVTDINGCNEIIDHYTNGIIIPPKDVESLKQAIKALLQEESLRQSLANNSRKSILHHFGNEFIWKALLEEYQQLSSLELNNLITDNILLETAEK